MSMPSGLYDRPEPDVWQQIRRESETVTATLEQQTIEARIVAIVQAAQAVVAAELEVEAVEKAWRELDTVWPSIMAPDGRLVDRGAPGAEQGEVVGLADRQRAADGALRVARVELRRAVSL